MKTFKQFLEQKGDVVALLPGGFKPPHKGHFAALKHLISESNARSAIVYIGNKERDGVNASVSEQIWKIYAQHLPVPTSIFISKVTPVTDVYKYVEEHPTITCVVGAGEEDMARYKALNNGKYKNAVVVPIPPQFGRISGTATRQKIASGDPTAIDFVPNILSAEDKEEVKRILGLNTR